MDLHALGQILQERRERIGLSRAAVGRRAGISSSYVSRVERVVQQSNGEPTKPSEGVLRRWAIALGWDDSSTHDLLSLAGYGDPSSTPMLPPTRTPLHYPQARSLK